MPKGINSLPEAKAEVERLRELGVQAEALSVQINESVEALSQFFNSLMGGNAAPTPRPKRTRAAPTKAQASLLGEAATAAGNVVTTAPARGGPRAPATMIERVLVIIRDLHKDLGRPVMPKDIEREYLLRSWPSPKNGTPYNLISGTVAYLCNQRKLLTRSADGYVLTNPNVQVIMPVRTRRRRQTPDTPATSEAPVELSFAESETTSKS